MSLINEICTVVLLIIVIHIIFIWIENIIDKNKKNNTTDDINKIDKVKNVLVLILGLLIFSSLIDIYNVLMKDTNSYIHVLGIFSFAKINIGYINVMFIFEIGQFLIYSEIIMLLILKSNKIRIVITIIFILVYLALSMYKLYNPYIFYKNAEVYDNLESFDIKSDFKEDNKLSEIGAIKIIKEEFKFDYIRNVKAEIVKLDEVEDNIIKYSCEFDEFWIVTFDYMKNFEIYENVCIFVDATTGETSYITY